MSIELHCTGCGKLIRAPEDAGGKKGKCPYCKQSVYVPAPPVDDGAISVAPIDEDDERRAEQLREESIRFAANVDHDAKGSAAAGAISPDAPPPDIPSVDEYVDIPTEVEQFVIAMRDSKLDEAQRCATALKKNAMRARDYVEGLVVDEMTPKIGDVPLPLMKGFLKKLIEELS